MPTVTARAIVWSTTAGNKATGSFTPAAGDLLVAIVGIATLDTAPTMADSQGGSWTLVDSFRSHAATGGLRMYVRNTGAPNTSMTVSYTSSGDAGGGIAVLSVTDVSVFGAGAVRSSGGQADQASGTPAPVLNQTPRSTNAIVSAVMDNTNGTANAVPRSGYTEHYDQGFNTPPTGIEVNSLGSGETSATITYGGTTPSTFASIAIEINSPVVTTGGAESAFTGSGTRETQSAKAGSGVIALTGNGARNSEALKSGATAAEMSASGMDESATDETGTATSQLVAEGASVKGTENVKAGTADSQLVASGAVAVEHVGSGTAILDASAEGTGVRPGEKLGAGVLEAFASGALQVETSSFGDASTELTASGDATLETQRDSMAEAPFTASGDKSLEAPRGALAALDALASGGYARELERTGTATTGLIAMGNRGAVSYERENVAVLTCVGKGRVPRAPLVDEWTASGTSLGSRGVASTE